MSFRQNLPLITGGIGVVTFIICFIITQVDDAYTGGLTWPYFSDMGRDAPGYYVFCIGLSICGVFIGVIWFDNYHYQKPILLKGREHGSISAHVYRMHIAAFILGSMSWIGLPLLSIFDTASYSSIHNYSSYWFIGLEAFACLLNTIVTKKINNIYTEGGVNVNVNIDGLQREFTLQLVSLVIFWVAFIIYIPVGIAIVCDWVRYPISECLADNRGFEYCTETMAYNETVTKMWDYSGCTGTNHLRSSCQIILIFALLAYMATFRSHQDPIEKPQAPIVDV